MKQDANAAADKAEEAAEEEDAKEKYEGEAKEGIKGSSEEDSSDEDEEEEEEQTMEERDARIRQEAKDELLKELQAAGGASAAVSMRVTHTLCMPHTVLLTFS